LTPLPNRVGHGDGSSVRVYHVRPRIHFSRDDSSGWQYNEDAAMIIVAELWQKLS